MNNHFQSVDTKVNSPYDNNYKTKFFSVLPVIFISLLTLALGINIYFYLQNKRLAENTQNLNESIRKLEREQIPTDDEIEDRQLKYFNENILPNYPKIQSEIGTNIVTKVYAITLKNVDSSAWLIEVDNEQKQLSHYLISSLVQKKLEHSMTSSSGEDAYCSLDQVVTIGNNPSLVQYTKEENGYLILSSIDCQSYGGGNSVAIYSLKNGEKIKISGNNFDIPGTLWKGISDNGNALGRLRGVYGIEKPIVIVEYGHYGLEPIEPQEIRVVAHFDLQTGKLIKTEKFN